ncbi:hypothetical protein [Sorangium sp. So ce1335]|uniref:hypothetical protein n=1 Tax=Sorangium sp. So ce1335 TaxID=3133335 RepID=UPI003F61BFB8
MQWRSALLSACVGASLFTPGCYAPDEDAAEVVGEAAAPQLDPDGRAWRLYTLKLGGMPFARTLVIGDGKVANYKEATEYWYVNPQALSALGSQSLVLSHVSGDDSPPQLSGTQTFALPRDVAWAPFWGDPVSGGALYKNGNVYLRITTNAKGLGRLTWYQILPSGAPAENIVPSGTFTPVAGKVSVPGGHTGFYIDQWIQ